MKSYISICALFIGLNVYCSIFAARHLEASINLESAQLPENTQALQDPVLATPISTLPPSDTTTTAIEQLPAQDIQPVPATPAQEVPKVTPHPKPKLGAHWPPQEDDDDGGDDDEEGNERDNDRLEGTDDYVEIEFGENG